jgi:hypothetical protein
MASPVEPLLSGLGDAIVSMALVCVQWQLARCLQCVRRIDGGWSLVKYLGLRNFVALRVVHEVGKIC